MIPKTRVSFELPVELSAARPAEARGLSRDGVRLLVADDQRIFHGRFRDLPRFLLAGDVLVVNTSGTIAAATDATRCDGRPVVVHFSTPLDDGSWIVELRTAPNASDPVLDGHTGETLILPGKAAVHLAGGYPRNEIGPSGRGGTRLWRARFSGDTAVPAFLARHGRPISYGYVSGRWPVASYRTVFANEDGSAEMPSAARPFTHELVTALIARGVLFAPVVLHTGVSSQESGEPPLPERFRVPASTARLVEWGRRAGARVIAVGTTAARAIESAARADGSIAPAYGWTDLVLGPARLPRIVDGILTGMHAPEASHLLLLEAVAGAEIVERTYAAALDHRYLWHEFGDLSLLLPGASAPRLRRPRSASAAAAGR